MLIVKTYVGPSKIHGTGLFAAEDIEAGQTWWRFDPEWDQTFSLILASRLPLSARAHLETYGFFDGKVWTICGDNAIFVNHSPNPNSLHRKMLSIAAVDILAGDEITENYAEFDSRPVPYT